MKKIVSYKIIPELRIIIEVFSGRISILDAIELKKREIEDKDYNFEYNFIVVVNEIETADKSDFDFSKYFDTIKENNRIIGIRKSAILTSTPEQVVGGTLYELAARELPMNFKIVSTIKAAMNWINLPVDCESAIIQNIDIIKNSL
jgi:hypothetical protein